MEQKQNSLIDDLRGEIAKKRCLLVVGSGVSIGATNGAACASWTGLLKHGMQRCVETRPELPSGWADRVNGDIESSDLGDLLSAAEKVSTKLNAPNGGEFGRWLQESVGHLKAVDFSVLNALRDLGCPIATTNYDSLLEDVTGQPAVTWMDGSKVERVLKGDEPGILHLHGHWQRPESVILGIRSYEQVLGDARAQHMQHSMATTHCMLFIGCGEGLADSNVGALLAWTGEIFAGSHYRRFRLARDGEVAALQAKHPGEQRLFVIGHGEKHDSLPDFLRSLAPRPVPINHQATKPSPAEPPSFTPLPPKPRCLGRDELVEALVSHLASDQPKPVPVLGPPGIGKTNLALTAAHHPAVSARFGARRLLVRCDGAKNSADLVSALSNVLQLPASIQNPESAVRYALSEAPTLLIIDNTETPWEADMVAVESLLASLAEIPGLALVITLRGVQRPQLAQWHQTFEPRRLLPAASQALFIAIAGNDFQDDPHLLALLDAVDHVPLAISLLAPLAEGEPSLAALWATWQAERTAILKRAGGRDRLTNLELSYELSWQAPRMTDRARQLLQRLALLPAGVKHEDLAELLPDSAMPSASVLRKMGLAYDEADRIRVLAPLREAINARHPLEASARQTLTRKQMGRAVKLARKIGGREGGQALLALLPEYTNIETLALTCENLDTLEPLIGPWSVFATMSGRGSLALLIWVETQAKSRAQHKIRASVRFYIGKVEFIRSQFGAAINSFELALRIFKQTGDLQGQANCIQSQGDLAKQQSDIKAARDLFDQALAIYKQTGDLLGQANCIRSQGDLAQQQSDMKAARDLFEQALAIYKQTGNLQGQANCIRSQGDLAKQQSDIKAARDLFDQALAIYKQTGDLQGQATCIKDQGNLAQQQSDMKAARDLFEQALAIYKQIGNLLGQANCIRSQGDLAQQQSDMKAARDLFEQALALYKQTGELLGQANCMCGRGKLQARQSNHAAANSDLALAIDLFEQTGNKSDLGECHRWIGHVAAACGEHDRARLAWMTALRLAEASTDPFSIGAVHALLARCTQGEEQIRHRQEAAAVWSALDPLLVKTRAGWENIDPTEVMPGVARQHLLA